MKLPFFFFFFFVCAARPRRKQWLLVHLVLFPGWCDSPSGFDLPLLLHHKCKYQPSETVNTVWSHGFLEKDSRDGRGPCITLHEQLVKTERRRALSLRYSEVGLRRRSHQRKMKRGHWVKKRTRRSKVSLGEGGRQQWQGRKCDPSAFKTGEKMVVLITSFIFYVLML